MQTDLRRVLQTLIADTHASHEAFYHHQVAGRGSCRGCTAMLDGRRHGFKVPNSLDDIVLRPKRERYMMTTCYVGECFAKLGSLSLVVIQTPLSPMANKQNETVKQELHRLLISDSATPSTRKVAQAASAEERYCSSSGRKDSRFTDSPPVVTRTKHSAGSIRCELHWI